VVGLRGRSEGQREGEDAAEGCETPGRGARDHRHNVRRRRRGCHIGGRRPSCVPGDPRHGISGRSPRVPWKCLNRIWPCR